MNFPPKNAPTMNEFWRSRPRQTAPPPTHLCGVVTVPSSPFLPACPGPGRTAMAAGVFPAAATLTSPQLAGLSRGSRPLASAAARQEPVPGCLPPHGANSRGSGYLPSNQIHPSANTAASDRPGMMVERLGMSAVDSGCCLPSRCQPKIGGQGSQHLENICS